MRPPLDQLVTFFYTNDLPSTDRFYGKILGLPLVLDQGVCHIYQVSQGAFLGFCQAGTAVDRSADRVDGVIITLVSSQVEQWHEFLVEQKVPIEKPPTFNPQFNIFHTFIRDPNGYLVEIQSFLDPSWPKPAPRTHV